MKCTFQFPVRNVMMQFRMYLTAAHAQIHGEAAVYVKVGSTISLTCTINLYSVPPPDITWYHGSEVSIIFKIIFGKVKIENCFFIANLLSIACLRFIVA